VQEVELEVTLPDDQGRMKWTFRVTGIVGFLVAKTSALVLRDKPKDAYDIVWLLEAWAGGPVGAAGALRASGAFEREEIRDALSRLATEFTDTSRVGPRSYARFTALPGASPDDVARPERQASGAVQAFVQALQ